MRICTLSVLLSSILLYSQSIKTPNTLKLNAPENRPNVKITAAAWLAGSYQAEGFGGTIEEIWAPPSGGTMMGMFKLWQGDSAIFYEFFILVEEQNSLALKLKHFNPDLSGWEEKTEFETFELVKAAPDTLWFDGLTYCRTNDNNVRVFLAMQHEGRLEEIELYFRRVK